MVDARSIQGGDGALVDSTMFDDGGILPYFDRAGDKAPIESGMRAEDGSR
jgi:hypothetical protein